MTGRGGSSLGNLTRLVFTMMKMTADMAKELGTRWPVTPIAAR